MDIESLYFSAKKFSGVIGANLVPAACFFDLPGDAFKTACLVDSRLPSLAILDISVLPELEAQPFLKAMLNSELFKHRQEAVFQERISFPYELWSIKKQVLMDASRSVSPEDKRLMDEFYCDHPKLYECLMFQACTLKKAKPFPSWPERLLHSTTEISDFDVRPTDQQMLLYSYYHMAKQYSQLTVVTPLKAENSWTFLAYQLARDVTPLEARKPLFDSWIVMDPS